MSLKISLIRGLPLIKFMRLSWDLECCHIELSCMLLHRAFQTCSQVTFLKTTTGSRTGRGKKVTMSIILVLLDIGWKKNIIRKS